MLFHVDPVFVLRGNRSKYRRCLEVGKQIKLVGPKIVNTKTLP